MVKKKESPDEGKPVICSCCTYSSAGKKTIIYSNGEAKTLLSLPVKLNKATTLTALIDSGASSNFIHQDTAKELKLKLLNKEQPQAVNDIQGKNLGWISKFARVVLNVSDHEETIDLNVIPLGKHGLVMGLPWLQKHDPEIRWSERRIRFTSPFCKKTCNKKLQRLRDITGRFIKDSSKERASPNIHHSRDESVTALAQRMDLEESPQSQKPGRAKSPHHSTAPEHREYDREPVEYSTTAGRSGISSTTQSRKQQNQPPELQRRSSRNPN